MKQIIQDLSKGHTLLEDIPVPMVKKGTVLIKTHRSLVSLGTEKINYKLIQKMINEAVNEALHENGLITESSEKSNEVFSFKVGKHIFEGKVTKIKKLS